MLPAKLPPRTALFLDVDGTLIDIAPTPDAVVVPPALKRSLALLTERLDGALALVSGRTIADLDRLFHPLHLRASGVHGAEIRFDPDDPVESAPEADLPAAVLEALSELRDQFPATLLEDKRYSAALHYRASPDDGPLLADRLAALVEQTALDDLRVLPGHMVFELKRASFDKGVAITRFMERAPFTGRRPVFLGDDVTDEPGFAAVAARDGMAIAVGVERHGASALLPSPEAVRHWLASLAETIGPN